MCADQNLAHRLENGKNDNTNGPLSVAVTIDINDIYDGALKVLKLIRPFWPIDNVKFKVGFIQFFNIQSSTSTFYQKEEKNLHNGFVSFVRIIVSLLFLLYFV